MDKGFQNWVKELPQNKIAKLERDIADLEESTQAEASDSAIGRVSRMDSINHRSVNEATLRKKGCSLRKLTWGLKRLENLVSGFVSNVAMQFLSSAFCSCPNRKFAWLVPGNPILNNS
jgi:hypothetical protein